MTISMSSILSWGIFSLLISHNIQITYGQGVECPNFSDLDAWTKVVGLNDGLSFRYAIVLSASGSPENSIMCGELESITLGWIGFGISPAGMCFWIGEGVIHILCLMFVHILCPKFDYVFSSYSHISFAI